MTDSAASGPVNPVPRGITAEALRLFASVTRHLQSLIALMGVEGREAVGIYVRVAIALGAALFFAAFGYIFVLLFVAFALERFLHVEWIWIALGFAIAHLLGAMIGTLYVKNKFPTPVFRGTAEEIRRDVAALRSSGESVPLM